MDLELEIAKALSTFGVIGAGGSPKPVRPNVKGRELTYDDVRDERIEVAAQHSLVRLSKKTPAERQAATEMVAAVKSGQLLGILQENQQAPAKRARSAGGNWWEIVPPGSDATMQKDPYGAEQPILVFRGTAANDADKTRLDDALSGEWRRFIAQTGTPQVTGCVGAGIPNRDATAIPRTCASPMPGYLDVLAAQVASSRHVVRLAIKHLRKLESDVAARGIDDANVRRNLQNRRTMCAVQWSLRVAPTNPLVCPGDTIPDVRDDNLFMDAVRNGRVLLERNLRICIQQWRPGSQPIQSGAGPESVTMIYSQSGCDEFCPGVAAWGCTNTEGGGRVIFVCDAFFDACWQCQRDVLTHELFHVLGLVDIEIARENLTSAQALTSALMLTQLASYLVQGCTDFCGTGTGCQNCPRTSDCDGIHPSGSSTERTEAKTRAPQRAAYRR